MFRWIFIIWVIWIKVTSEEITYQRGTFPYSKCLQNSDGISCEEMDTKKGLHEKRSIWPLGIYALRMHKHGCPEGHSMGWRKGVLDIRSFPSIRSELKIEFCVKERVDGELDRATWMPGRYTVFRQGDTCPEGFTEYEDTWNTGSERSDYTAFGYLPSFIVTNDTGVNKIVFHMCEHISEGSWDSSMLQTNFLLGLRQGGNCEQLGNDASSDFSVFNHTENTYCLHTYKPYELLDDVNVAVGKPAKMSSMFGLKAVADNAVDGNLSLMHEPDQLCFHTLRTTYNWWYVDLLGLYQVDRVKLYNRGDGFEYRAREIEIQVGNTLDNLFKVGFVEIMGLTLDIYMPYNTVGRYVKLYQIVEEYLHFCEIEVYSSLNFQIGTFSELISDFFISSGILYNQVVNEAEGNYSWYQFDLRHSLEVFEMEIQLNTQTGSLEEGTKQADQTGFQSGSYVSCFYDDISTSSMQMEAKSCHERIYFHNNVLRLYLPNVRGRFFTLYFDETRRSPQPTMQKENVKIFLADFPETGLCNEDLGMADGSIQNFQLSASSWFPDHTPISARPSGNNWCPRISDTTHWFLVDLIASTVVEGITIWTDEPPDLPYRELDDISSIKIYFGIHSEKLLLHNDIDMFNDNSRDANDMTSYKLLNPIETRFIKLEFQNVNFCIRFEIHGCKLSGIPSLKCLNSSEMFKTKSPLVTEGRALVRNGSDSLGECLALCSQDKNCSIAKFGDVCTHYQPSHLGQWQIDEHTDGEWAVKLCPSENVELFPTLLHTEGEMTSNIESIVQNSVISSIGYPFTYQSGMQYKWLISFPAEMYIRLVFTNVSLGNINETCFDHIFISKLIATDAPGKVIDQQYNGRVFIVETSEGLLLLTFRSCLTRGEVTDLGFRAIVTGEVIPACLSIDSDMAWDTRRHDVCTEPEMVLTSMSLLNLPFTDVEEIWEIHAGNHQTVQLHILDFYVVCPHGQEENTTRFAVVDAYEEKVYCNIDLPPEVLTAQMSTIVVKFRKVLNASRTLIRTEGFRLRYTTIDHSMHTFKDVQNASIKVCSTAFNKCYRVLSSLKSWDDAADSCYKCNQTLVTIESSEEMDFVNYLLRDLRYKEDYVGKDGLGYDSGYMAHIGLKRYMNRLGRKMYVWENMSPVTYAAWRTGNPSGRKDCTRTNFEMFANRTWESEHCSTDVAQFYVCQSLMDDVDENGENGLCTCPNGWIQNEQSCYFFAGKEEPKINWTEASKACKKLDSYLVEVEDAAENKFMEKVIQQKENSYWIGATDLVTEGIFLWNHSGKAVVYTDWLFGEPNNWNGNEDCVRYWWEDTYRKWNDDRCHNTHAYICEKSAATIEKNCANKFDYNVYSNIDQTYSGNKCQFWNALTTTARDDFRARFPNYTIPTDASNNCADPTVSGILWCFTTGSKVNIWEPCLRQFSDKVVFEDDSVEIFECDDGFQVDPAYRCDGRFHCQDWSDEMYCANTGHHLTMSSNIRLSEQSSGRLEKAPYFRCGSDEWISVLATCDDVIDCLDVSDELNCSSRLVDVECVDDGQTQFCDKEDDVCDFTTDSSIAADEFRQLRPCDGGQFMCSDGRCIHENKRCNAYPDCKDESDEKICDSCKDAFHCDNVKCIPMRLVCDAFPDCEDGSDETFCFPESLESCGQFWERGYHISGEYMIDGIKVYCDFSAMDSDPGKIIMSIQNIDVAITQTKGRVYTRLYLGSFFQYQETDVNSIIHKDGYECFLEVQMSCKLHTKATLIENLATDSYNKACQCQIDLFKASDESNWVWQKSLDDLDSLGYRVSICNNTETRGYVTGETAYYTISEEGFFIIDDHLSLEHIPVEITPGPLTCVYEYKGRGGKDLIACEGEDKMIDPLMRCLYDVDPSGFLIGCRSGGHLRNCENFTCPLNTVKCPGSYCIPLNFVCDNKMDCPGGYDEYQCACGGSEKEILILVEDSGNQTESKLAARKLADQFYSTGNLIRIHYFKTFTPLEYFNIDHRLLEIREESVETEIRNSECRFKSLARELLENVRFDKSSTSKSIIFIEESIESSEVARIMFSNLSVSDLRIYRVFKDNRFSLKQFQKDVYQHVKDVHVNKWSSLYSVGFTRFPEICEAAVEVSCNHGYRCSSSRQCIPLYQVCDGIAQCNDKDDEWLCDFFCPTGCACVGYTVDCHGADLDLSDALSLSINTLASDMSHNPGMQNALQNSSLRFPHMTKLNLSTCEIEIIAENAFQYLDNLQCLDLGYNKIKVFTDNTFGKLVNLVHLYLYGNFELREIASTAFHGLKLVRNIQITGTKLKRISAHTFSNLSIESIDISNNQIEEIEDFAFNGTSVGTIDFRENDIVIFNKHIFDGVASLKQLLTPGFKFCCIRPCYVSEDKCLPKKNEFSSCGDLMRHPVLQAVLWLVGITALFGNMGAIFYRLVYDRARLKIGYGIFVANLAAADFLMGVYLIMIAVVDSLYRNRYIFMDDQWRNSKWCVTAGVLSTVSSEASVLFLILITLDRVLVIKYPFGNIKFGPKRAYVFCLLSWIIALFLSIFPLIHTSYFQHKFYSRSGVCIALPLTRDKPPGWKYSVGIFVGLNFCTFILVAVGQVTIFLEIRKASILRTQKSRKRDLQVARNLILVATTDFMCWFPIGLMGIMALSGYPIPGDVYAWTAVFILPLNSALNPILYTLTAIIGKQSFNPSLEEQTRTDWLKETGSVVVQYNDIIKSVRTKGGVAQIGTRVYDLQKVGTKLAVLDVLATAMQLSKYLSVLHESSVCVDSLTNYNTYIKFSNTKSKVNIVIDSTMATVDDDEETKMNILQFGKLLRHLMAMTEIKDKF